VVFEWAIGSMKLDLKLLIEVGGITRYFSPRLIAGDSAILAEEYY
jgi:hypothetical protein